jgi:hypothetical protein
MAFFSQEVTLEFEEGVLGIVKEPWELWRMGSVAHRRVRDEKPRSTPEATRSYL